MIPFKKIAGALIGSTLALSGFANPAFAAETHRSNNWAGYVAEEGEYTGVGASWIVPQANDEETERGHATWVGIGGFGHKDLIQAGTMAMINENGNADYFAWIEMLPEAARKVPVAVSPGDFVSVRIAEESTNRWRIRLKNVTTGETFNRVFPYQSKKETADWIHEMVSLSTGAKVPLDDFEKVKMVGAYAIKGGRRVELEDTDPVEVVMVDKNERTIAKASALRADGESFTVSRTETPVTYASVNSSPERMRTFWREIGNSRRIHIDTSEGGSYRVRIIVD